MPYERVFDSSAMKTFARCPRKYYWRYVRDLVPQNYNPAPLNFGTAIHEALRVWYETGDMDEAIAVFHKIWEDRFGDSKRTHEKGEEILRAYAEEYPKERFEIIGEPETGFTVDVMDEQYVGRFDLVVKWGDDYYVLDHKTATRMGGSYYNRFNPDMSITGYTWAAEQLFDVEFRGVMINVLYFTTRQMDFDRQPIYIFDWQKKDFVKYLTGRINEIKALDPHKMEEWEQKWVACTDWGTCKYRELCLEQNPEPLAKSMYREEAWNPLNKFGIENIEKKKKEYEESSPIKLLR